MPSLETKPVKIHLGIYVIWVENFLACVEIWVSVTEH